MKTGTSISISNKAKLSLIKLYVKFKATILNQVQHNSASLNK